MSITGRIAREEHDEQIRLGGCRRSRDEDAAIWVCCWYFGVAETVAWFIVDEECGVVHYDVWSRWE